MVNKSKQQSSHNVVRPKNSLKETGGLANTTTNKLSQNKAAKPTDKDKNKDKAGLDEPEANPWPPFNFDGSQALKSKLVLNVRSCNYDLFRTIALEELNWKIVDHCNRVWEPVSHNPNLHSSKEKQIDPTIGTKAIENNDSTNDNSDKANPDYVKPWPYYDLKREMRVPVQ